MPADWRVLLTPKALTLKRAINKKSIIRRLPVAIIVIMFWAGFYVVPYKVISYLNGIGPIGDLLVSRMMGMVFFGLMGFVALSSTITAISSIYLARDLSFLRSMPVDDWQILTSKSVHTVISSTWMVLSFMPPVFVAAGIAHGAGFSYYPSVFVLFLFFIFISAGAGMLVAHLFVRVFPAKRMRDALMVVGMCIFIALYFILKKSVPGGVDDPLRVFEAMTSLRADLPLLPSYWFTHTVWGLLKAEHIQLIYPLSIFSTALFSLMLSLYVGRALYVVNIERMRPARETFRWGSSLPSPRLAIVYKDMRLFARDAGQWSQVLIILALIVIYVHNFASVPMDSIEALLPHAREIFVLLNLLMAGMVLSAVAGRFLYTTVSLEGPAFWILRAAPVPISGVLRQKLFMGIAPVTLMTVAVVSASNLAIGVHGIAAWGSIALALLMAVSVSGLGIGLGAMRPVFSYDSIASVAMGFGAIVFMFAAMMLVLATVSLAAWPYYLYVVNGQASPSVIAVAGAGILAINAISFLIPLHLGRIRLEALAD